MGRQLHSGPQGIERRGGGPQQSRAVAAHAAAVGVSGALSFGVAGAVNAWLGWQVALVPGALGAASAFVLRTGLPCRPHRSGAAGVRAGGLLDFPAILRNRSAIAYSVAVLRAHLGMSALRGGSSHSSHRRGPDSGRGRRSRPATVASVMALSAWASVWGNELASSIRCRRVHPGTMLIRSALGRGLASGGAAVRGVSRSFCCTRMLIWSGLLFSDGGECRYRASQAGGGATCSAHSTTSLCRRLSGAAAPSAARDSRGASYARPVGDGRSASGGRRFAPAALGSAPKVFGDGCALRISPAIEVRRRPPPQQPFSLLHADARRPVKTCRSRHDPLREPRWAAAPVPRDSHYSIRSRREHRGDPDLRRRAG